MLIEVKSSSMADVTPSDDVEVPPKFAYKEPTEKWEEEDDLKKEKSLLVEHFKDFTDNTSLHGLQYVGEDGRNCVERSLWCLSVIGSCILCGFLVYPIYSKWQNTPTITSVEETNYAIWNIYFPAVTVCSNNKVVQSQIESLLKLQPWKNISKEDENFETNFRDAIKATVLYDNEPEALNELDANVTNVLDKHRKKFGGVLQKVMHTCSKMILACVWQGKMVPCTELFSVRRTDDGFCCSFNTLRMSEQFKDAEELKVGIEETGDDDDEEYDDYGGYGGYGYYGGEYGEYGEEYGGEDDWDDPWGYDDYGEDEYGSDEEGDDYGGGDEDGGDGEGSDYDGDSESGDEDSDDSGAVYSEGDGEQNDGGEYSDDNGGSDSDDNEGGNADESEGSDDNIGNGDSDDGGDTDGNNDDSGGGEVSDDNGSDGDGESDDGGSDDDAGDGDSDDSGGGGNSDDASGGDGDSDDNGGDGNSNDSGAEGDDDNGGEENSDDSGGGGGNSDDSGNDEGGDSDNNGGGNEADDNGGEGNSDDSGTGSDDDNAGDEYSDDSGAEGDDDSGGDGNSDDSGGGGENSDDSGNDEGGDSDDSGGDEGSDNGDDYDYGRKKRDVKLRKQKNSTKYSRKDKPHIPKHKDLSDHKKRVKKIIRKNKSVASNKPKKLNKIIGKNKSASLTKLRKFKNPKKGMKLSEKSKKFMKNKPTKKINKHKEVEKKLIRKKRAGKFKRRRANASGKKPLPPTKLKRSNAANSRLGLSLLLYPDPDNYGDSVLNNYVGFKVLVHSPYDFAEVAAKGFVIDTSVESFIAVSAQYTESTDVVREMPLFKRDCLRHDEDMADYPDVKLSVFSNYSRKACLLECQATELFKRCECLPYYFPDFSSIWKRDTSCNYTGLKCLAEVSDQAKALKPTSLLSDSSDITGFIPGPDCNCPSDCKETLYSQEMSQAKLRENNRFIARMERPGQFLYNLTEQIKNATKTKKKEKLEKLHKNIVDTSSVVHIYFKELGIVKYSKDQLYGALDVIAAFGGMVGLCIGFSILSGLEIIYWFTFRLCLEIQKRKKKKKA